MYEDIGPKPDVNIWDIDEVLSMKVKVDDIPSESFCSLDSCGFSKKRLIGPALAIAGIVYLIFNVTA